MQSNLKDEFMLTFSTCKATFMFLQIYFVKIQELTFLLLFSG